MAAILGRKVRGAVSTGSLSLDVALGIGGLPRGRIVEVFGPESSGKTTLVYHVIAEAQRRGGICAFIDAEHAMDPTYAKKIEKEEARIDWSAPAAGIDCKIRGLSPFPGAWCEYKSERLKILFAEPASGRGAPGEVLDDLPPHAAHLLAPSVAAAGGTADVLLGDAPAGPRRRDGCKVDAELCRDLAHER